jgi:hypothetical protein
MAESGLLAMNSQVEFQLRREFESGDSIPRSLVPPKMPGIFLSVPTSSQAKPKKDTVRDAGGIG